MSIPATSRLSIQDFVDQQGLSPRQRIIALLMFLVMIADGMEITLISHIFPSLIKAWNMPMGAVTVTVAASVVAMALGMLISGPAAERWGRKPVALLALGGFSLATAALGLSRDIETFIALRIVSCLGLGAAMPLAMTIVDDWMPTARRAQMVTLSFSGVALGSIIGAYLSAAIIPTHGWQALVLVAGLGPLLLVPFIVALVPDAPAVQLALGRSQEKVRRALALIARGGDAGHVDLAPPAVRQGGRRRAYAGLLSGSLLVPTLLIWLVFFIVQGVNLLILQYMPILLQQPSPGLDTQQSGIIVAMWGWGGLTGQVLMSFVLRRLDRFLAMALALAWAIAGMLVIAFLPLDFTGLLVLMFVIGLALPAAAAATFPLALLSYPPSTRATGLGAAGFSGRIGALCSGMLGGGLIASGWGLGSIFLMLSAPLVVGIAALSALRIHARKPRQGVTDKA